MGYLQTLGLFANPPLPPKLSLAKLYRAGEDRMILGMQDFDFAQIESDLPKSNRFCPNFA